MPSDHATFGSSTAKRTNACPAWVSLSAGVPRHESKAAADGTIVHTLCELTLLGSDLPGIEDIAGATTEHMNLAADLLAAIDATMAAHGITEYEPEVRCTVAADIFGTLDVVGIDGKGLVLLGDIKSGRGFQVEVEANDQILFAAWAALQDLTVDMVTDTATRFLGVIWQPDRNGEVQTKEWIFTPQIALDWGQRHMRQIDAARKGGCQPVAGAHCAFCPAAFKCPAKTGAALEALQFTADDLTKIAWAMDRVDALKSWCADVEKAAYNALEVGQSVPGWKLVAKRASRKWKDEGLAVKALRRLVGGKKYLVQEKLLGIGAVEKLLKQHEVDLAVLDGLTIAESSGTTLAPESDKRQAVLSSVAFASALASIQ
jgi:Protein of unknown function (DUF2800)